MKKCSTVCHISTSKPSQILDTHLPSSTVPKQRGRKISVELEKKNIIWFNPPFSANAKTNIGAQFLKLIDKHFQKSNPLSKIVNRNCVKISYRCTPNIAKIVASHNLKIMKQAQNLCIAA